MSKISLPNYFQCPNMVVDEFMSVLSPSAFKMMMFLIRQTTGFNSAITDSTPQGRVVAKTGMSRTTIYRAQSELKKHNLITVYGSKKEGYSYEVNYKIQHDYKFKTLLMFQNDTLKKHGLMFQNETSYVSNWNILYILNTLLKDTNKKYIKKNEGKSSAKGKKDKKVPTVKIDFFCEEVFAEFKNKFEFINFADYSKMVKHLGKLFKKVSKKRITSNLQNLKMNKGRDFDFDADAFSRSVDVFVQQVNYKGIWVQDAKRAVKGKNNAVDNLPTKKSENTMSDEELDAEIAKKLGEVA